HAPPIPLQENQILSCVIARPPIIVVLVSADRFWQTVLRAKKIDRSGFPIISRKNSRFCTNLRGKGVVHARNRPHHFRPANLVAEVLLQSCSGLSYFGF